ncbi:autoinducer binding domain-containing protein [Pseudomonas sp. LB3P31]
MEQWKESQLTRLSVTTEISSAYQASLMFVRNIGFKFCSFSTSYLSNTSAPSLASFDNYPAEWNFRREQETIENRDPIVAHCNHSMFPVVWTEGLFSKAPWMWEALEQHGLQHGWSQSFIDEDNGLCSTLSLARSHCPITAFELYEKLGYAVFIGHHLHTLVTQTLPKPSKTSEPTQPHLSDREIEVLKLAAAGKTAGESAKILNVTARTINFHIQSAIAKFGVSNKISAVIAATRNGLLTGSPAR